MLNYLYICKMKIFKFAIILPAFILLCGCTQYNGYIGPIFGSWSLVAMSEDGIPIEPGEETVFSFQNEIVRVVGYVDPPYTTVTKFGNFIHNDNVLTLKFQSEPTPSGSYMYMAPDWLYFPKNENIITFEVQSLKGSEMVLRLESDEKTLVYSFKKTW